jgi:hypothetical protein
LASIMDWLILITLVLVRDFVVYIYPNILGTKRISPGQ